MSQAIYIKFLMIFSSFSKATTGYHSETGQNLLFGNFPSQYSILLSHFIHRYSTSGYETKQLHGALLEKLVVTQLLKKVSAFYGTEASLPYS
jgi:hypothetical protein